jgi:anti-sigma-K factor RskA
MTSDHTMPDADEIEALLPWHAAGTLSRREAQRVEAALAQDPELARRYELVREELAATIHLNETLGAPSPRAMQDLFAKIEAEPHRRAPRRFGARIAEFVAGLTPQKLTWAAAAAAVVIVLQAGLIAGIALKETSRPTYETASAPGATATEGAYALVRFAPQASMQDINTFLAENKLGIAGGPLPGGLYRVKVAAEKLPSDGLAALVRKLSDNKVISFIAPTQ